MGAHKIIISTKKMMWYQHSVRSGSDNPNKVRCCETTLKQTVCKRKVSRKGGYCWQHPRGGTKVVKTRPKPKQKVKSKSPPVKKKVMKKKVTPKKVARKQQIKRKTQTRPRSQFSQIFRRLDFDNDGLISKEEFRNNWLGGSRRKIYAK